MIENLKYFVKIIFVLFPFVSFSQRDTTLKFINEFGLSANTLVISHNDRQSEIGFGISCNHIRKKNEIMNFVYGIELNLMRFHQNIFYVNHNYPRYKDLSVTLYNFTVPISLRFNFGNKHKYIFEFGAKIDLRAMTKMKGIYESYVLASNNQIQFQSERITKYLYFDALYPTDILPTISLGLPIKKNIFNFILKFDYTFGIVQFYDYFYNRYLKISILFKLN